MLSSNAGFRMTMSQATNSIYNTGHKSGKAIVVAAKAMQYVSALMYLFR